jgi:hypothetical protein
MSCKPQLLDSHGVLASCRTELTMIEDSRYLKRLSVEFMYNSLGLTFGPRLAPAVLGEAPAELLLHRQSRIVVRCESKDVLSSCMVGNMW